MNDLVMNPIPGGAFWNAERFFQARTVCGVAGAAHRFS
ncbi:hypothetical protein CDEN61S_02768 [Castellaniella denitrificans]